MIYVLYIRHIFRANERTMKEIIQKPHKHIYCTIQVNTKHDPESPLKNQNRLIFTHHVLIGDLTECVNGMAWVLRSYYSKLFYEFVLIVNSMKEFKVITPKNPF